MSNRGIILLAVGMLVLGLVLGLAAGGAVGFFAGQSRALAFGARGTVPFQQMPNQQLPNQQQPNQQQPFQQPAPFPTPRRGQQQPQQPQQTLVIGAQVEEVTSASPAEKAGVKVGDVITAVGGTKLDATHALADLVQAKKPGDKVDLTLTRDGKEMTLSVTLGSATDNPNTAFLGIRY
jgi:membrane-associated protease RseP (regulator of RpoE activity)